MNWTNIRDNYSSVRVRKRVDVSLVVIISRSRNIFHQFRQIPMIVNRRWKTGNVRNDKNSVFESRLMESYDILRVRVNVRGEKSMVLLKIQSYAVINWYKNDAGSSSKINDTASEEERQWNGHWQRFNGFQPPLTFFFSFPPLFFPWDYCCTNDFHVY